MDKKEKTQSFTRIMVENGKVVVRYLPTGGMKERRMSKQDIHKMRVEWIKRMKEAS